MANESAVENISDLKTTETCAGCGEEVNLLVPHLRVTISPTRSVIESVDAALVGAETDDEGNIVSLAFDVTDSEAQENRERFYVGTKFGAGEVGIFHSYSHLAEWAAERADDQEFQASDKPTIKRLDVDPQAEGRSSE